MGEHENDETGKRCFGRSIWRIGRILVDMCGVYGRKNVSLGEKKTRKAETPSRGQCVYEKTSNLLRSLRGAVDAWTLNVDVRTERT